MSYRLQYFRHTSALIHLDHLSHNVRVLRKAMGGPNFFCPMVKANAYGHGDVEVALRLEKEGVSAMGVGLIEEGQLLRQMGIQSELLVFGIFDAEGAVEVLRQRLTPVISTWEQLRVLESQLRATTFAKMPYPIHLKFDTGMHRLGFDWLEAEKLLQYCIGQQQIFHLRGICTHLHSGEDAVLDSGSSVAQLQHFAEVEKVFAPLGPISHTLNSAGLLSFAKLRAQGRALPGISLQQGVRPGLAIYGYGPGPLADSDLGLDLKPVMSLRSHIVRLHQVSAGDGVSYGHTWRAGRKSVVGVVPMGYADGYHRTLSNRGVALVAGKQVPVVGNVCMDYLMVDVTDVVSQNQSDIDSLLESEVTLFGEDKNGNTLLASELATKAQTVTWEILTSISERVPRVYVGQVDSSM